MSKNRKRRLRRLASAILGAVSMTGMDATPTAAREVPQERGWNWPAIGVGTAGVLGTAGLGLTMYGMFGRKSIQDQVAEEQFKKIQAENKKKLEDEQYQEKVKQIKLRHGLTDTGVNNMVANFNALRPGMPILTNDDILANLDKVEVQKLIKTGSQANNAVNNKKLLNEIVKIIQGELTPQTLNTALAKLTEAADPEQKVGDEAIVTYKGRDATANLARDTFLDAAVKFEDVAGGPPEIDFTCVHKDLTDLKEAQREAGNIILPDGLKGLLGNCMPIALVAPALKPSVKGEGAVMLGGGDEAGVGILNSARARTREDILDGYRDSAAPKGGEPFARIDKLQVTRKMADEGKLPTDIVIGPQIQSTNTGAGTAVGANVLAQMLGLQKKENEALKKINKGDYKGIYKNIYKTIRDILNAD